MRKVLVNSLLVFALLTLYSCKNKELTPVNNVDITPGSNAMGTTGTPFDASTQTLISQGDFKNGGRYSTSGTAKLYRKGTTYTLVFEAFKTDQGPDLRVYLSEDTGARNFIELVELENSGNFYLTLPNNAKVDERMFVLVWCKRFSALFGSAELKASGQM
ncbi:DM13 domain-containing protein [Arundinibacter roseus]|uniref:DM13 domain-containing protein n=1 Tax=Arundinibacter roseus TaxID=2070510 RepID=A0A4V2X985_9BACT|nr:DM13 domain-containing protein [Arundinibacter roseus]TDB62785.1 hypothetical protein EZE20_17795 [Arundinibacter roseus]